MSGDAHNITRDDVAHVANLARLDLSEADLDRFTDQLGAILDHAADLTSLDLHDVEPMAHPVPLLNVTRPDEVRPSLDRVEVLDAAPAAEAGQFRVPPILGEEP